jgi:hypothetical protein
MNDWFYIMGFLATLSILASLPPALVLIGGVGYLLFKDKFDSKKRDKALEKR